MTELTHTHAHTQSHNRVGNAGTHKPNSQKNEETLHQHLDVKKLKLFDILCAGRPSGLAAILHTTVGNTYHFTCVLSSHTHTQNNQSVRVNARARRGFNFTSHTLVQMYDCFKRMFLCVYAVCVCVCVHVFYCGSRPTHQRN